MRVSESFKSLASFVSSTRDPDLTNLTIGLIRRFLRLQNTVDLLAIRNYEFQKEIERLKERLTLEETLVFEKGVYYSETSGRKDGPFCSRCWDVDHVLVRLKLEKSGWANCPECRNSFDFLFGKPKAIRASYLA
jgi:hypothetical protein